MSEARDIELPSRPYPGLRPFQKTEWPIFFGREPMSQDVIGRLIVKSLVAVHGDSGCGKSSLIEAGVLPVLERDQSRSGGRWSTFTMRPLHPEASPLANLATALAKGEGENEVDPEKVHAIRRLLNRGDKAPAALAEYFKCGIENNICILLDQFEELFEHARLEGNTEARLVTSFLVGLAAERPKGLHAIFTMRSDYLGRCAQYEGFAETVNQTQYLVPRMERPALIRAICEPAKLYSGSVALELADRLIADAGEGQDQLPLIQHGLMRIWQRKAAKGEAPQLTLADLGDDQTLANLLSDHADEVMAKAVQTEADKKIIEDVFRALSGRTPEGAIIRRRCTFKELSDITGAASEKLQSVLAPFRADEASFLRPYGARELGGGDAVDVSHEAFIRNWSKFTAAREGLLDREAEDSLQWSSLSLQAKSRFSILFPLMVAYGAWRWLAKKNANWTRRYGGDFNAVKWFVRKSLIFDCVLTVGIGVFCIVLFWQYGEAQKRTAEAQQQSAKAMMNETIALASLSRMALEQGLPVESVKLALAAWPRTEDATRPALRRTIGALNASLSNLHKRLRLEGHGGTVFAAAFSPDGARVVTGSYDTTARIWDAATGTLLKTLEGHKGGVSAAAFSPDGTRIVTGSGDNDARIWNAATGNLLKTLDGHTGQVIATAFSPDGARIVTGSGDNAARIWNAATGALLKTFDGHTGQVYTAAFSSDGARIVTGSGDNTARIWDAATGTRLKTLEGHTNWVSAAAFSPDGARVVTGSGDKTARIWDTATGSLLKTLAGHTNYVSAAAFSPDGARIVTGSWDNTVRIWDAATGTLLKTLEGHTGGVYAAAFSPDGAYIVTGAGDNAARVWDAATDTLPTTLKGHTGQVYAAAFSPDGARVVTGSGDKTARIWDTATGSPLKTLTAHTNYVSAAAFSPDGTRIVTGSDDNTARIWDAATGTLLKTLEGHTGWVYAAAFSPDGTRIVTGSQDNTARIWYAATGTPLKTLEGHTDRVTAAAFSPDGARIVTGSGDKTARIWDAATGTRLKTLEGHTDPVYAAAFSPDGARIVTGSGDNTTRIWDAATGTPLKTFDGHTGQVYTAAFSSDGARIVTGSGDNTARIWDAATGTRLKTLEGHTNWVSAAAFSPDGARIVTGSWDNTARLWDISDVEKGDAFHIACRRLGNDIDLKDVQDRYGLDSLPPICGDHPPLPVDLRDLQ